MANRQLDARVIVRNATAAEWTVKNPVLLSGELGYESDTRKSKIGDGLSTWLTLRYSANSVELKTVAPVTSDLSYDVGTLWLDTERQMLYYLVTKSTTAVWVRLANASELTLVDEAIAAHKLKTARNITLSGDITGTDSFDGSEDMVIVTTLKNSGAAAGTYTKLTINAKGLVTSATTITAADIPNLTLAKITDAKSAASRDVGTAAGNVPILDSAGHLPSSVLPPAAITNTWVVTSQAAMLALTATVGDVAVRTDLSRSYILRVTGASTLANWQELSTPTDTVLSVNGKTGVISLTTSDIAEGSNKYYTEARATANFNGNFPTKSITELSDGANVVLSTDTLIINGGGA